MVHDERDAFASSQPPRQRSMPPEPITAIRMVSPGYEGKITPLSAHATIKISSDTGSGETTAGKSRVPASQAADLR